MSFWASELLRPRAPAPLRLDYHETLRSLKGGT